MARRPVPAGRWGPTGARGGVGRAWVGAAVLLAAALLLPSTSPGRSAPSAAEPAPTAATLQAGLDELVRAGIPGAVLYARRADGEQVLQTAGLDDLATHTPMDASRTFDLASLTKPYVATLVLQLVDERVLSLDDTLARWLPGLVPYGREVTVRELLQHTSGIPDYAADYHGPAHPGVVAGACIRHGRCLWSARALTALVARRPPRFEPGRRWSYSNTNYVIAGMVVERATGRPLAVDLRDRILGPLGLHDTMIPTRWVPPPEDLAHAYVELGGHLEDMRRRAPGGSGLADGALLATAPDVGRFLDALFGGRLVSAPALDAMRRGVPTGSREQRYGLGLFIDAHGTRRWVGHVGGALGYASIAQYDPASRGTVVLLMNATGLASVKRARAALMHAARSWASTPAGAGSARPRSSGRHPATPD